MKFAGAVFLSLFWAGVVFAQNRVLNPAPFVRGTFGNVVFPGGTAALPGVQRTFPNAVFPAGTGPRLVVPGGPPSDPTRLQRNTRPGSFGFANRGFNGGFNNGRGLGGGVGRGRSNFIAVVPYAVPVYAGGYENGYAEAPPEPVAPQQPNVIVIYPQAPQPLPVPNEGIALAPQPETAPAAQESSTEPSHYLIALKDHTIYSAVAYWVEGDTLHYFTSGSTHNQVSLSLVDKALTERLNRESGITMQLPN